MKKDEIQIGQTYKIKVSGNIAEVRITGENAHGGWDGVNVATNRAVRIKSAQRIRSLVSRPAKRQVVKTLDEAETTNGAPAKRVMTKAEYEAQAAAPVGDVGAGAATATEAASEPKGKTKRATGEPHAKRPSGLDAAAAVLAEAGTPLNAKEMVERMLATGMWQTGGKTPSATIYAAIIREIAAKQDKSRFRKTERGKFELAK
jgi:hypothetical protein